MSRPLNPPLPFRGLPPIPSRGAPIVGDAPPSYDEWFDGWAREVVAWFNGRHPDLPAFDLAKFNGCSAVPDMCRNCCLIHDCRYWFREDRGEADREFRDCIASVARTEYFPWRWYWHGLSWTAWAGVRLFGGRAWMT